MGEAIRHGFANLTNFSGRDSRALFWWWVLVIVIITVGLSIISGVVFAAGAMGSAFQAGAAGVDPAQIEAEMMRSMTGNLDTQAWVGAAISLVGLALLIASFVRRLRDAGLPALIAIVPVLTTLFACYVNVTSVDEMRTAMLEASTQTMDETVAASSGLGLVAYVGYLVVIVCGLIPSKNVD